MPPSMLSLSRRFQSTLPRGERPGFHSRAVMQAHFNPRSREGSDENSSRRYSHTGEISIHAPARGATVRENNHPAIITISIHAPARGATIPSLFDLLTHNNFNPRSREGSDSTLHISRYRHTISIHAPARGATSILSKIHPDARI